MSVRENSSAWPARSSTAFTTFGLRQSSGSWIGWAAATALPAVSFTHYNLPESPAAAARAFLILALLSAVLAHYLEINFGIAIAVTRTYFWIYAALLLLVGVILPSRETHQEIPGSVPSVKQAEKPAVDKLAYQQKASKSSRRRKPEKPSGRMVSLKRQTTSNLSLFHPAKRSSMKM